jgi:hypothetical protein
MVVTASELRMNIYRLLDQVLETGVPLEIERKGRTLQIVAEEPRTDPPPARTRCIPPITLLCAHERGLSVGAMGAGRMSRPVR